MKKPIKKLVVKNLVKEMNIFISENDSASYTEIKSKVQAALLDAVSESNSDFGSSSIGIIDPKQNEISLPHNTTNNNIAKEVHTTHVNVLEVKIEANTKDEILDIISKELEKYNDLHRFSGCFFGSAKSEPIVEKI